VGFEASASQSTCPRRRCEWAVTWAFLTVEQRFADVRERPDRPVGHGKADAPRPSITCLQSQIGGGRHLRSWGSGAGRGRRGVVRGCPLGTDHDRCEWHGSGTARGQPWYACRCWVHLDHRVRAVRGNHGCMGKPLQTARQLFPMPSGRGRMGRWLRRPASMPAELGSSRLGAREDLLAAFLGVRD
jgi:hypothetical protein